MTAPLASHILDAIRDSLEPRSEAGDWNASFSGITLVFGRPGRGAGQRSCGKCGLCN